MAAYALPGIFVMGCLVYFMEPYVIRCPEQSEWNIRAEIRCQNITKYFCLYNYIHYTYVEGCTGPEWDIPGSKCVYSRDFNNAPCNDTRYQPIKFVTNGSSDCIFRKSLCTEEGQTLLTNGSTKTDSTCRCDYKQGYAFVTVPRNKCFCRPSEEDCSCYMKKCQGIGYNLSADYECTKDVTKKTVCLLMSENPSEDPHIDMAPTGTPREYDSYAIKRTCDVAILVSIFFLVIIVITICALCHQRLPRCPCLSTNQCSSPSGTPEKKKFVDPDQLKLIKEDKGNKILWNEANEFTKEGAQEPEKKPEPMKTPAPPKVPQAVEELNVVDIHGKTLFTGRAQKKEEGQAKWKDKSKMINRVNLFVKNLNHNIDDERLRKEFSQFGTITSAKVETKDGRSKGFGLVCFRSPEEATKAMTEMNGRTVDGKAIYVAFHQGKEDRKAHLASQNSQAVEELNVVDIHGKTLFTGRAQKEAEGQAEWKDKSERINRVIMFVKNLDDNIDDERLRKEFSQFGTITSAKVETKDGRSKGFGYVCFSSPEEATKAITEMDGRIVDGKALYVAFHQRKEDRKAHLASQYSQVDGLAIKEEEQEGAASTALLDDLTSSFKQAMAKQEDESTPGMRKTMSASKGLNRDHFFISKTVIKPETCTPCGKRIEFGRMAMKCKDCKASCHPHCKDSLPLPCRPTAPNTPGGAKLTGGLLSDYTPMYPPYIPGIIVHCVNEVEARGLTEIGLYRVPGSDSQVKELKEDFLKGKGILNLSHIDDILVVCGCIKDFLRGLKEPLVTYALWKDFVHAAENRDKCMGESEIYQAISKLPTANRDTLAFLILHLIRVSECKECKMPSNNLAKVFGPIVIGYSFPDPEPLQMINETKYQAMVMNKFFEIPESYWEKFLNIDEENLYSNTYNTPQTPDGKTAPKSYLGPIHTPETYEHKSKTWGKNAMTPTKEDSNMLYRLLRPDESWRDGLCAKNPHSTTSVFDYVIKGRNGTPSKYISTCGSWKAVNSFRSKSTDPGRIAKIQKDKLPSSVEIIDLRLQENRDHYIDNDEDKDSIGKFNNFAKIFEVVLLVGHVPEACIELCDD